MPVSSPSYFPPNSSTDQVKGINAGQLATGAPSFLAGANAGQHSTAANLIIIGDNSGKGGITDNTNLAGTIIIGDQSAQALVSAAATQGALTILGSQVLQNAVFADTSVLIGFNITKLTTASDGLYTKNVIIGNAIGTDATTRSPINQSVVIGYEANNTTGNSTSEQNVVIGCQALQQIIGNCSANVVIGFQAQDVQNTGMAQNVLIGAGTSLGATDTSSNVVIGFQASAPSAGNSGSNVGIGASSIANVGNDIVGFNVVIGAGASVAAQEATGRNVIIGGNAGHALPVASGSVLVIETNNPGHTNQLGLIFGSFLTGNLVLGNSITGTNQDFGGTGATNILKLLNGTAGNAAPIGGGYFYVLAGVLHWVDSAGNDTTLSVPAAPTTGASTATFVATNKPGATTGSGPVAWENRVIDGISYQSPLWAT